MRGQEGEQRGRLQRDKKPRAPVINPLSKDCPLGVLGRAGG